MVTAIASVASAGAGAAKVSAPAGPLQHAYIIGVDPPLPPVEFLFNPKQYSIDRPVGWESGGQKGVDVPESEFVSGKPRTLNLELFVDAYEEGADVAKTFVAKLEQFASVHPATKTVGSKPRPPYVRFGWGETLLFKSVITQLKVTYTLFHPDGRPARGNVTLAFKEVKNTPPGQNPTSAGEAGRRSHRVLPGETLDLIAFMELGDAALWPHIADQNELDNPFAIRPGQQLVITDPR